LRTERTMSNSNAVVLEGKDLAKEFIQGEVKIQVLRAASISVRAGERIAIVGASGSGKTTLLQLLGGLDLPTGGRSCGLIRRLRPGLSCCHEPNAALPFKSVPLPSSAAARTAPAPASMTMAATVVRTMLCIRTLHRGWMRPQHDDHRPRPFRRYIYEERNSVLTTALIH